MVFFVIIAFGVSGGNYIFGELKWLFFLVIFFFIFSGCISFVIAFRLKCDFCKKRCVITMDGNYKEPYWSNTLGGKIRDFFYPPELKRNRFKCCHCGVEVELGPLSG